MLIKDSNITIHVSDMDKSVSFYQSLGLKMKNRWGNHYAQLEAPGLMIGLHPSEANALKNNSGNVSIGFTTEDFEATKSFLQSLLIPISERNEEGGQFIHFKDPDGTELYFIKPKWQFI